MNHTRLRRDFDLERFLEACNALGIPAQRALRDPVGIMPSVASATVEEGSAFLRLVLTESVDLERMARLDGDDASALFVVGVWCRYASHVRRTYRKHRPGGENWTKAAPAEVA